MEATGYQSLYFRHPDFERAMGHPGLEVVDTGRLAVARDEAAVRQAILLLLSTVPGERVMRPEYGCEIRRLIFSSNDETTAGLAVHYVRRALELWEPRIEILHVDARCSEMEPSVLVVSVRYALRSTGQSDLVEFRMSLMGGPE